MKNTLYEVRMNKREKEIIKEVKEIVNAEMIKLENEINGDNV